MPFVWLQTLEYAVKVVPKKKPAHASSLPRKQILPVRRRCGSKAVAFLGALLLRSAHDCAVLRSRSSAAECAETSADDAHDSDALVGTRHTVRSHAKHTSMRTTPREEDCADGRSHDKTDGSAAQRPLEHRGLEVE